MLKEKTVKNKRNKRLDQLFDALVHTMYDNLFAAIHFMDDWKNRVKQGKIAVSAFQRLTSLLPGGDRALGEWTVRFGASMFNVRLRGYIGDGPFCDCPGPESHLCIHIWIVILGKGYSVKELIDMGFVGDSKTRLNTMLFRTLRGTPPVQDAGDEGCDVEDAGDEEDDNDNDCDDSSALIAVHDEKEDNVSSDLDTEEQRLFVECRRYLDAAFAPWHQLRPKSRVDLRNLFWNRFRSHLSKADIKRRTLTDTPVHGSGQRLPRTSALRSKRNTKAKVVHRTVLESYMLQDIPKDSVPQEKVKDSKSRGTDSKAEALPTKPVDMKKNDWKTARKIIGTAVAGDVRTLTVAQLGAVCKGLGISYSGFNKVSVSGLCLTIFLL